jgi:hypothetical protein
MSGSKNHPFFPHPSCTAVFDVEVPSGQEITKILAEIDIIAMRKMTFLTCLIFG